MNQQTHYCTDLIALQLWSHIPHSAWESSAVVQRSGKELAVGQPGMKGGPEGRSLGSFICWVLQVLCLTGAKLCSVKYDGSWVRWFICPICVALDHICGPACCIPVFLPPTATGHTCVSLPGQGCKFQVPPGTGAKGCSAFPEPKLIFKI